MSAPDEDTGRSSQGELWRRGSPIPAADVKRDLITAAPDTSTQAAILRKRGIGSLQVVTERDLMDIASEFLEEKLRN